MDDPCRHCEKAPARDQYVREHFIHHAQMPPDQERRFLRQALKQYRESDEKYKQLIACAPDAIFIADAASGVILEANRRAAEMLGIPVEDVVGMHAWDLHPKEEAGKYKKLFRDHVRAGSSCADSELFVVHRDGTRIPVQINAAVTRIGNKKVIFGIFHDISSQKTTERKLSQSEQNYRELYNQAQVALYRTRIRDGKVLECNHAMAAALGYESKEQCLEKCYLIAHYANPGHRTDLLNRLKANGSVEGLQVPYTRRDGSRGWVEITAKLYPEEGYIEGMLVDITVSKVLTQMEKKVLDIILEGKSNREIADILNRSVRTIEDHRAHIMRKLNVHNLIELVQKAQCFEPKAKK